MMCLLMVDFGCLAVFCSEEDLWNCEDLTVIFWEYFELMTGQPETMVFSMKLWENMWYNGNDDNCYWGNHGGVVEVIENTP